MAPFRGLHGSHAPPKEACLIALLRGPIVFIPCEFSVFKVRDRLKRSDFNSSKSSGPEHRAAFCRRSGGFGSRLGIAAAALATPPGRD